MLCKTRAKKRFHAEAQRRRDFFLRTLSAPLRLCAKQKFCRIWDSRRKCAPTAIAAKKAGRSARKRLGVRPAPGAGLLVMGPSGRTSHHRLLLLRPIRCLREKGSNHPPPAASSASVKGQSHGTQSCTPCAISELVCADLSLMQQAPLPATHAPRADRCCVGRWPKQASHHSTPMLYTMDQTDSALNNLYGDM
jgi:hypothetical protein